MRPKHQKPRRGYKTNSRSFLNQVSILGDKGMIYTTPQSNGNYYFRTWIAEEGKYYRRGLQTKNEIDAIILGEEEMLDILSKIKQGHKIFGSGWGELCEEFLGHQQKRVDTNRITQQRHSTIKTQVNKWIVPYIGKNCRLSELDINSFMDYGMWRRNQTNNIVKDTTIRNEYTTINAIIKFAERSGLIPFGRCDTEEIKITNPTRRDTFTPEEYKKFYTKMREWVSNSTDTREKYYRSLIRDFILIKSNAFLRFGELSQLRWGMCKIIERKGKKLLRLELPAEICKNRKPRQVVSRGGKYLERIKGYSEYTQDDDFVFNHQHQRGKLAKPTFYKYWKNLLEFSEFDKLPKKLTYYSLRHFGITARLYAKVPYFEVAKLAGTEVRFLEQHYAHLDMEKLMDSALKSFRLDKDGIIIGE